MHKIDTKSTHNIQNPHIFAVIVSNYLGLLIVHKKTFERLWGKIEGKMRVMLIHQAETRRKKMKNKKNHKKITYKKSRIGSVASDAQNGGCGVTFAQIPKNGI